MGCYFEGVEEGFVGEDGVSGAADPRPDDAGFFELGAEFGGADVADTEPPLEQGRGAGLVFEDELCGAEEIGIAGQGHFRRSMKFEGGPIPPAPSP